LTPAVAGERIGVGRSDDVLEIGENVAGGVAAALRPAWKVDGDPADEVE
jgi:hypothetical protein